MREPQGNAGESPAFSTSYVCKVEPHHDRIVIDGRYYSLDSVRDAWALVRAMRPYVEKFDCADAAELEAKAALLERSEWVSL